MRLDMPWFRSLCSRLQPLLFSGVTLSELSHRKSRSTVTVLVLHMLYVFVKTNKLLPPHSPTAKRFQMIIRLET